MKRLAMIYKTFGVLLLAGFIPPAYADWAEFYVLGKAGLIDFDLNDTNIDPLLSFGFMFGLGLTRELSFEAEYNQGLIGGDYTTPDVNNESGTYYIWTSAGYLSYRLPFNETMYAKLKLGMLYENIRRDSAENEDDTARGWGTAGGVGLGVLAGQVLTLELELTQIDLNVRFLSIGAHYSF